MVSADMELSKNYQPLLQQTCEKLSVDMGIISHIIGQKYIITQLYSSFGAVKHGDRLVTNDTYCREVITQQKMITYDQIGRIRNMVLHPVYTAMQLESYIGLPIVDTNRNTVGTLNFSGLQPKSQGFSDLEIAEVTLLRDLIQADCQSNA